MNYPMQSYGLGGLNTGPVQNMSDRNMAETLMANGGQRFSAGGISNIPRMAAGGAVKYTYDPITGKYTQVSDAISSVLDVPKYTYDPITQRYTLDTSTEKKKQEGGDASGEGGSGSGGTPSGGRDVSGAEKAAFYSANPNMGAAARGLQSVFGLTSAGRAQAAFDPDLGMRENYATFGFNPDLASYGGASFAERNALQAALSSPNTGVGNPGEQGGGNQSGNSETGGQGTGDGGAGSGGGRSAGDARGGFYNNGKFDQRPANVAQGGIANLGDYSDGGRLLRGPGDGVSDSIPATIANKQPARLADGEFVVPARIVSELGNGSTEAGARKLYQMLARVQNARKKSIGQGRVAVNSRADKMLPA